MSGAHLIAAQRAISALLVLLLAGCAAPAAAPDSAKIDDLLTLIGQRLGYMNDVARNKWNTGAPIEDLPREREIIESLGREAAGYGLDAAMARDFFRAQIEASKIIQRTRFAEWRAQNQPPFKSVPDLRDHIRPALDALTPKLMQALVDARPSLQAPGGAALVKVRARSLITVPSVDVPARDEAISPLERMASER
jgi:chorismate mutase